MRSTVAGLLFVLLAPTLLLAPSLFGGRHFVPFDIATFPPIATTLDDDELIAVRERANFDATEVVLTFIEENRFVGQELREGRLPQWNPYARFGVPLQATAVVGLNYPPNWLSFLWDDPRDGFALRAWLSLVLACGFMFGFLRSLGLRVEAAVLGALAFGVSGTLVAQAHFYQRLASLVWLPAMLWGVRAVTARSGRGRGPAVAGLAVAVTMNGLAGFPQYGAPAMLVTGIYALARLIGLGRGGLQPAVRGAVWLGVAIVLGGLLASVQFLPMTAFFPESSRGTPVTGDMLAQNSLAPGGLLGWIMPTVFGHPHTVDSLPYARGAFAFWLLPRVLWEKGHPIVTNWNFIEGTIFVGTLVLPLALFAALRPKRTVERGMTAALVVLVILSGGYLWLSGLHLLPGLKAVDPIRFCALLCAPLAILGACGLDRLVDERESMRRRAIGIGIPLVAFGLLVAWQLMRSVDPADFVGDLSRSLYADLASSLPADMTAESIASVMVGESALEALIWNLGRAGFVLAAVAVWWGFAKWAATDPLRQRWWLRVGVASVVLELGLFAAPLLDGRELPVPHDSAVHQFLRRERDRLAEDGGYAVVRATAVPLPPEGRRVFPFQLPPCGLVPERIRDVNGYTFMDAHSHKVIARIWGEEHMVKGNAWPFALPDDARLQHPYLDLIGVRWVLSEDALQNAGKEAMPQLVGPRRRPDGEHVQFHVYERARAMPRAFVVPRLETVADEAAAIEALAEPTLEPRAVAFVLEQEAPKGASDAGSAGAAERTVRWTRDDVQELAMEVDDGPAGWLVLNDSWFSGWSATVNGSPVELTRANLSMRALRIPAGAARVEFHYEPPRFRAGLIVTLCAAAGIVILLLVGVRRRGAVVAT